VVFHDDDLARLAGRPGAIADLALSEIRTIELIGGGRVPTLVEAIEAAGDLLLNVELKTVEPGRPRGLPAAVAAALAAAPRLPPERVVVSSFDPVALWQFHLIAPTVPLGFLFEARGAGAVAGHRRRSWARRRSTSSTTLCDPGGDRRLAGSAASRSTPGPSTIRRGCAAWPRPASTACSPTIRGRRGPRWRRRELRASSAPTR
jgi:hypothetical protein